MPYPYSYSGKRPMSQAALLTLRRWYFIGNDENHIANVLGLKPITVWKYLIGQVKIQYRHQILILEALPSPSDLPAYRAEKKDVFRDRRKHPDDLQSRSHAPSPLPLLPIVNKNPFRISKYLKRKRKNKKNNKKKKLKSDFRYRTQAYFVLLKLLQSQTKENLANHLNVTLQAITTALKNKLIPHKKFAWRINYYANKIKNKK